MTLQEFEDGLKAAVPETYPLQAPAGKTRYVAWHTYSASSVRGDDRNQLDAPKVQLDIIYQSDQDTIADDVLAALWLMDLPYEIISEGYDPDYAAMRVVLQLVVI